MEVIAVKHARKIPFSLLRYYMMAIDSYFVDHEEQPPPSDLNVFLEDAHDVRDLATTEGELHDLGAALDFVLTHDDNYLEKHFDVTLAEIIHSENYQSEEVLKDILLFYRNVISPDAGPLPAPDSPDVEMVKMGLEDWRAQRASRA